MRQLAISMVVLMSLGCATGPTSQEIASAEYGAPPVDYKSQIKKYFNQRLKEPESVRYGQFTEPTKGYSLDADSGEWVFGYHVLVFVNAKNSYGGYTGEQGYSFLFRDGKMVEVIGDAKRVLLRD